MYKPGDIVTMLSNKRTFLVVEVDNKNHLLNIRREKLNKYGRLNKISSRNNNITAWYSMNDFVLTRKG